jgi:hypothetical protein
MGGCPIDVILAPKYPELCVDGGGVGTLGSDGLSHSFRRQIVGHSTSLWRQSVR